MHILYIMHILHIMHIFEFWSNILNYLQVFAEGSCSVSIYKFTG